MSMIGELTFFLRLQIRQLKKKFFFSQSKYGRVVKKFSLKSFKHFKTPMRTTTKLTKDAFRKYVEEKLYRSMIGNLLYLIVNRPNIFFNVGVCVRYPGNLKVSYLMFVKWIIHYINGALDYDL